MGGERYLMFKSPKECDKAKKFLAPLEGNIGVDGKYGSWIEDKSAKAIQIGYSFGARAHDFADLVSREIAKRFDVRKIGADSVGWYGEECWEKKKSDHPLDCCNLYYKLYNTWAEWVKDYRLENSHEYGIMQKFDESYEDGEYPNTEEFVKRFNEIEEFITGKFKELDEQHKDN